VHSVWNCLITGLRNMCLKNNVFRDVTPSRLVKNYGCFGKRDVSIFSMKELGRKKYSRIQGQRERMPIGERTHSLVDVRPRLESSKLLVMQ
jgi:hypothetical protein